MAAVSLVVVIVVMILDRIILPSGHHKCGAGLEPLNVKASV